MMEQTPRKDGYDLTPEQTKRRRARNIAIALGIGAFIVLFYILTIVRLGGAVAHPPAG